MASALPLLLAAALTAAAAEGAPRRESPFGDWSASFPAEWRMASETAAQYARVEIGLGLPQTPGLRRGKTKIVVEYRPNGGAEASGLPEHLESHKRLNKDLEERVSGPRAAKLAGRPAHRTLTRWSIPLSASGLGREERVDDEVAFEVGTGFYTVVFSGTEEHYRRRKREYEAFLKSFKLAGPPPKLAE